MSRFVLASLLVAAPLLAQDATPIRVPDEVSCRDDVPRLRIVQLTLDGVR